ncbi:matrixin family metalloprotease [Myxococcota bacterium]|nr:matrixin family metalloprotease [Myxococcota bacterium]
MPRTASLRRSILAFTLAAASVGPLAGDAHAYVCTQVKNKTLTQAWNQRCIPYWIDRRGTLFSGMERQQLVAQSFRVWSGNACTDLEFLFVGFTDQGAAFDPNNPGSNENVVVSIEDPAGLAEFPTQGLLAITLTSYSTQTGEIFDADILMNAVDFDFDDVTDTRACMLGRRAYDLRNTLIHEMGHLIGFDHPPAETESTMYASAEPCEIKKRDLNAEDLRGICTIYPKDQPVTTCQPPADYDSVAGADQFRCQCAAASGMDTSACDGGLGTGCTCVAAEDVFAPEALAPEALTPEALAARRAGEPTKAPVGTLLLGTALVALTTWRTRRRRG